MFLLYIVDSQSLNLCWGRVAPPSQGKSPLKNVPSPCVGIFKKILINSYRQEKLNVELLRFKYMYVHTWAIF